MAMMSDLPQDLVEEILSRVLITCLRAVRSTCKLWNALSKDRILCKAKPKHYSLGFMMMDSRVCSMRVNLDGIFHNEGSTEKLVDISKFQVSVSQVYYCDGLLLCVTEEKISRLVLWNPYLGQTRWIQPITTTTDPDTFIMYALGYDKNKNHKILRIFDDEQDYYEIYDVKSSSWRVLNGILNWKIDHEKLSASVDGNTYFWITEQTPEILICFDFTKECFGQFLPLPLQPDLIDPMMLSSVKEKKLALLNHYAGTSVIEIWITTKIEPNVVLWTSFLKVDMKLDHGFLFFGQTDHGFLFRDFYNSFFIDEEKRVAVIIYIENGYYTTAYIIGENGNLKKVCLGNNVESRIIPIMCFSSYVPSLVQIKQTSGWKRRDNKRNRESPQDYSFLSIKETQKQIMNRQLLEMSRFSVSPINRDEEALKIQHGSFLKTPDYFETEERIISQEPHEMSRFSVSPINRDEEAFKSRHGSFSFSETTNYSQRSLDSTGNNNSDSFGSARNIASMNSQRDDFRPEKQHTMSYVSNSFITDGVGMYKKRIDPGTWVTRKLQEAYDNYNLQRLGMLGERYGTPNLYSFKDQSNLFLCSGGNKASISSQSNMNQNAKVSNTGVVNIRPEIQQKMFTSSIDSFTNINPQHGNDNYQRSGERYGTNNIDIFGPFGSIESMMKAQTEKEEIKMMPTPSLWSIKKILTQSDVNPNIGCLHLLIDSVDKHIRIHIPEADFQKVVNIFGLNVNVFDYDTSTLHELRLGVHIHYVLKGNWLEDFLQRRNLRQGDEIGLFWDCYASRLQFSVISRAKTKAPAVKKEAINSVISRCENGG